MPSESRQTVFVVHTIAFMVESELEVWSDKYAAIARAKEIAKSLWGDNTKEDTEDNVVFVIFNLDDEDGGGVWVFIREVL